MLKHPESAGSLTGPEKTDRALSFLGHPLWPFRRVDHCGRGPTLGGFTAGWSHGGFNPLLPPPNKKGANALDIPPPNKKGANAP